MKLFYSIILITQYAFCQNITELQIDAFELINKGNYNAALPAYTHLANLMPQDTTLLCNKGFCLKKLGLIDQALESYAHAITLEPNNARAHRGLSHLHLLMGNFNAGWQDYEWRWTPVPPYAQELKNFLTQHTSLHGIKLLLITEYGLGDTLQFIRYAQEFKKRGATVMLLCQKSLVPLLSLCPYIDHIIPNDGTLEPFHFQLMLMSSPLVFDTHLATIPAEIPYLFAQQDLVEYWHQQLSVDKNFKIGICWQADVHAQDINSTAQLDAQEKSIPLPLLAQLSAVPGVSLYSLQKINGLEQLALLPSTYHVKTFETNFDASNGSFMDTAALMKTLDLVITIDTSIAHLAGGLGVPVWVCLPHSADWRWLLDRDDSPWYPTMRLFRQPVTHDWQSVLAQMQDALLTQITNTDR